MSGELSPYPQQRATSRELARTERGALVERLKLAAAGERGLLQEGYDYRQATIRVTKGFDLAEHVLDRATGLYQKGVAAIERCGGSEEVAEIVAAEWAYVVRSAFARTQTYMNGGS